MGQGLISTGKARGARASTLLSRFAKNRKGATAIEFALLALPFCLLTFAILESCISFAGQEVMANATDDVARELRTGQVQKVDITTSTIQDMICQRMSLIVAHGCPGLLVDLRHYDTFADAAAAGFQVINGDIVLTKNGTPDGQGFTIDPGASTSKNMLRVFYKWPVMTDFMAKSMANLNGNKTLLFASMTWQNEPFDDR